MNTHKYKGYEYVKEPNGDFYIKLTDGNWAGFPKSCGLRKTIDWLNHDTLIERQLVITTTKQLKEHLAKESENA